MFRVLVGAAFFVMGATACAAGTEPEVPDFSLKNPEGQTVTLSAAAQGRPQILFFWATWCPYCKALMPHLQSIELEYGDATDILAINVFEDGDPVAFIKDAGYDFNLLLDGDSVAEAYGITGTPGVLIVSKDRHVHFDLRKLPPYQSDSDGSNHRQKAALRAPYWAAAIRQSLDRAIEQAKSP